MTPRAFLLRAALLSIVVPGCGGSTTDDTGSTGPGGGSAGAGGGTAGAGGTTAGAGGTTAGSGGSTAGAGGSTAGAGGGATHWCKSPVPVVVAGKDTGVEKCADGSLHVKEKKTCPSALPTTTVCMPQTPGGCATDADCTAKPNGHCGTTSSFGGPACTCIYGCTTDADCTAGSTCLCGDPIGTCIEAKCTSDASCGGAECMTYDQSMGCDFLQLACHTPKDQCGTNADCTMAGSQQYCVPDATNGGAWSCKPGGCAVGRPLVVDQRILVAGLARRADWG